MAVVLGLLGLLGLVAILGLMATREAPPVLADDPPEIPALR